MINTLDEIMTVGDGGSDGAEQSALAALTKHAGGAHIAVGPRSAGQASSQEDAAGGV